MLHCAQMNVNKTLRTVSVLFLSLPRSEGLQFTEFYSIFTRATLASTRISCRRVSVCLSVYLSVCLSQVGVFLKRLNVGSRKKHHTTAKGLLVFWCRKSLQISNEITPNGGTKCMWGRLNAGAVAGHWRLSDAKRCQLSSTSVASLSHWASTVFVCSTFAVMQRVARARVCQRQLILVYTCL